jgi:hypothetical protein
VNPGLGDGNCLLFHGFVDSDLVCNIHLVELVNSADSSSVLRVLLVKILANDPSGTYSQHQSTGLNGKFASFWVFDN